MVTAAQIAAPQVAARSRLGSAYDTIPLAHPGAHESCDSCAVGTTCRGQGPVWTPVGPRPGGPLRNPRKLRQLRRSQPPKAPRGRGRRQEGGVGRRAGGGETRPQCSVQNEYPTKGGLGKAIWGKSKSLEDVPGETLTFRKSSGFFRGAAFLWPWDFGENLKSRVSLETSGRNSAEEDLQRKLST